MSAPTNDEGLLREGDSSAPSLAPTQLAGLHKTITMAQIAKAAGVSQGAISSLLNDRDYGIRVSDKTRERVFKVCRELGYIPNDLRAVVRMYPELGDFCLLLAREEGGLRDSLIHRLATAAMGAVAEFDRPLSLGFYEGTGDYREGQPVPHPIATGSFSKFLFHGMPNPSLLEMVTRRGLPAVSLGSDAALPGVTSFVPDYAHAAVLAIEHLVERGHTHLGIVSGPFGTTHPRLLEFNHGVGMAYESCGLPMEAQSLSYGDLSEAAGEAALDEILAHQPGTTAIFAMSDRAALGVRARAQARGIRIPEQLSLVGCADDAGAMIAHPQLTTVHLPAEEMAEAGIREIDRLVREGMPDAPRKNVLPVHLVVRESTAAPRAENVSQVKMRP